LPKRLQSLCRRHTVQSGEGAHEPDMSDEDQVSERSLPVEHPVCLPVRPPRPEADGDAVGRFP